MKKKFALLYVSVLAMPAYAKDNVISELEQVIVTAPIEESLADTPVPVTVLSDDELRLKVGHSIGETLKNELGITSQSFGPGVGTPVIRGQSGPRVRVLANGIGSNDASAISPDHATSVEPLLAERIEVLRGPATLLYGSGAIGGVVNVIDNRIPEKLPEKRLGGALEQRFDSVSDETATTMKLEGGKGHLAYHLDGFFRDRNNVDIGGTAIDGNAARQVDLTLPANLQNTKGVLANSSASAISGSAGLSLIGAPGFAGVAINRLESNYGIAPDGTGGEITRILLKQSKYDFKSELKNPFYFAEALRMKLGYTDYRHTEVPNSVEAAYFTNKTYESRLELAHKPIGGLHGALGFQAIASDFTAIDKSTLTTLVPETLTHSYGVFAVESFSLGTLNNQLGFRVEDTTLDPQGLNSLNYLPVSASAASLWKINRQNSLNLALTRSQRAPQVQELLVHGYHDATRSFEIGNSHLHEETSYNLDLGYKFTADWLRAELDLFHNWANDYIYQQRTGVSVTEDGGVCPVGSACAPIVQTRQADAAFMGYESKLIFPLMENHYGLVELTLFSDYTRGQFVSGGDVPRMPPLRFGFQIDHFQDAWSSNLRVTRGEAQDHPGAFDSATAGYVLVNLSTQYQLKQFKGMEVLLFAKANNLLDENIRNSTSYLRNFAPEPGRGAELGVRVSY
ncbi:TonB-dependent receptor [Methylovulum psychrotolerans]|uniref:TonB-dependent receptor n=1 Tax=Methylovulum psychrotolerans TaxID=1704499 RepID=A0A2S5CSC8_9GAMM|nr:TonB-dependent receptor [Methylovulum psychrotolerans]POZ53713.1 TonB-dependent receptor [Methylovulum psychrotolerans]